MFGFFDSKLPSISMLDGPLRPNDMLEEAASLAVAEPDDLCLDSDGALLVTSGNSVLRLADWDSGRFDRVAEFDNRVVALACREDGLIAVALDGAGVSIISRQGNNHASWKMTMVSAKAVRACLFGEDGALLIADAYDGCGKISDSDVHDLFSKIGSGRIIRQQDDGYCEVIAEDLFSPYGLAETADGMFVVSESWSAQLSKLSQRESSRTLVLGDLAGYPARINKTANGGYILSCFARRDPLIEFVLSEKKVMSRMTKEIAAKYWIAPRLTADLDYRFPTQSGATRLFGEIKPWAPSFSYGLVIILDSNFMPLASAQSRANGKRHGITSALEWRGDLLAVSKGSNELLKVKSMDQMV